MLAGRYEILAPLGKGGMGMVYKATDHELEETVAVKVLRPEVAAEAEMGRRFRTEIRLARKVRHRNVCGIYEFGEDAGMRFIAMEYIEGVDLRKILSESGALPIEEAFHTCIHVAEGLAAIHEAGIIHRDLKTANLMRDANGVVRLMDFGIAKQVGDATRGATATGLVVGTPEYMSPEQARGEKVDHRSDIYALGVVAFEVFTGRVPFHGETPIATIFMHLQNPPPLEGPDAELLPASVVPVLERALAKKPADRFASAAEFSLAMARARDAAGVAPRAAGSATPRPLPSPGSPTPRPMPTVTPTVAPTRIAAGPTSVQAGPTTALPPPSRGSAVPAGETRVARLTRTTGQTRVAVPKRGLPIAAVLGAAAILVALVAGGLWLRRPTPVPVDVPARLTPTAPPSHTLPVPAAALTGTLVIDALPWGELVSVTDAQGVHHEPKAGRHTPLALSLAAGEYTVEVRHPAFPSPLSASVKVVPGEATTRVLEFRRVDAADYFRKTGL
jgi:serine/threonine-protein kinase